MKTTITLTRFFLNQGFKNSKPHPASLRPLNFLIQMMISLALIFSTSVLTAQTTPSSPTDCKTGCTSNDVQIQAAYLSDVNGTQLPTNFVCPASGKANVYLTLELTTKTPRIGVVVYLDVMGFTPPNTIGSKITTITECFGTTLNQPTNKVTFQAPFEWTCGDPIVLTDVFIGWGTGNSNFCTGSGFQCPATSSKCYSLPPGQYIPIQTPNATPASDAQCSTVSDGTTAVFDLTSLESTVKGGQTDVTVSWFKDSGLTMPIAEPSAYTSATGKVYAKVASNISPFPSSTSEVSLTVYNTPAAPTSGGDQSECEQSPIQTLTASATAPTGSTVLWYTAATGGTGSTTAPTQSSVGSKTVYASSKNTTTMCESPTRTAVKLEIKQAPAAPTSGGDKIECEESPIQTLTASATAPTGSTVLWYSAATGGTGSTTAPTQSSVGSKTVYAGSKNSTTQCESLSRTAVKLEIKSGPTMPTGSIVPISCTDKTFSLKVNSPIVGFKYKLTQAPNNAKVFDDITAVAETDVVFTGLTFGDGYVLSVENTGGCSSSPESCGAPVEELVSTKSSDSRLGLVSETSVKAYPNPFSDKVNFKVNIPADTQGSLELVNLLGQHVKTIHNGSLKSGINNFEVSLPDNEEKILLYILKIGDRKFTGKLVKNSH